MIQEKDLPQRAQRAEHKERKELLRSASLRAWMAGALASKAAARPPQSKVRQWRPSTKVNEHKEERSLERLDMEVSRKKDLDFGIFGESRGSETHFSTGIVYQSDDCDVNKNFGGASVSDYATYQALKKFFHRFAINSFNFAYPMNSLVHLGHRSHGDCNVL